MTVLIHIGRRVPRSWFRRKANTIKGLLTFQENIWQIINQSINTAKRKAKNDGRLLFVTKKEYEKEDLNYQIEWLKVIIQGTPEQEEEEYQEAQQLDGAMEKHFKKDFEPDNNLKKVFKSKLLTPTKLKEAYDKGYDATKEKSISEKLLEMGILKHIEKIDDYENREFVI